MTFALAGSGVGRALPNINQRKLGTAAVSAALVLFLLYYILPHTLSVPGTQSKHWETPLPYVVLGMIQGSVYGLLSVGLVLIYRSNRIINFAHGQIGAFGAALFGLMVEKGHVPYTLAIIPALAAAALVSAGSEAVVIRRLRKAPPVMSIVATLGIGTVLVTFVAVFNGQAGAGSIFPQPKLPHFMVGALLVTPAYVGMLVFSPIIVITIGVFLKVSKFGLGIRASASNPEAARMAGIFSGRMSSLAWAIAGAVAAFGAILTAPGQGFASAAAFGPSLLLRALVGAVVARMSSLPVALAAGIGLGVVEQLVTDNYQDPGVVELVLFVIILVAMTAQRQRVGRAEEKGSWAAVQGSRPLPAELREVWLIRNMGLIVGITTLVLFAILPLFISNTDCVNITAIFGYIIVGLSVSVMTGLGGQLSLGQFGISAVGAIVSYQVAGRTGNYFESFLFAGLVAALVSVVIGIPALRIKGLLLTVTTLSFALVVPTFLLTRGWAFGTGATPGRPIIFGDSLTTGKQYIYVALAALTFCTLLARNIRRGGIGRLLISVRDNDDAARAFTVSATRTKVLGFALAGFIAGIGGATYGHSLSQLNQTSFPTQTSIDVVVMTVIGGVSHLYGPMLGSLLVFFLPIFGGLKTFAIFANSIGLLLIIMYLPGGLGQLVFPIRDRLATTLARGYGIDVERAFLKESSSGAAEVEPVDELDLGSGEVISGSAEVTASSRDRATRNHAQLHERIPSQPILIHEGYLLEAHEIRKSFGGVRAVRGVSFGAKYGETLGLIGPNGAGKTTTFELLAGFTKADAGAVRFAGKDVTYLSPEARARLGLIRSFQDAALFPTLTVSECVQLSLERVEPTSVVTALAGLTRQEKRKEKAARDLVAWMGLDRYRSAQIQELSTGTRRITEIACLVALEPRMLLLDEPSSGVAQKETEALGELIVRLKAQLQLTLIVIEHDIPLIMGLSDRIVAMADGEVIAAGTPEAVRNTPAVVEAYLGGSAIAIERSAGVASAAQNDATTEIDLSDILGAMSGVSRLRASALIDRFGSLDAIRDASHSQLLTVPGIGANTARRVQTVLLEEVSS